MSKNTPQRLALTVEEARARLGLSRGLIYEAIRTGQIPAVRVGRRILIPIAALEQLLASPTAQIPPDRANKDRD